MAEDRLMADEQHSRIEHLPREQIARRGICRAVGVSLTWLLHVMVECVAACPDHFHVHLPGRPTDVSIRPLEAEADAMWSVVKKAHKPWIWSAIDAQTHQITAFPVGDRRRDSTKELWAKIPVVYWEQAMFHTDQYEAYQGVMPAERHRAITKKARKTNHTERLNHMLRQRLARLIRETLAFSKTLAHHMGAIKYCNRHHNLTRAVALPV
jgi:insertion element IS1 protein InsB